MSLLTMTANVSQEPTDMLRKLLEEEKASTKIWLRIAMNALVDPLVDSIFHRLETKFTNRTMERNQSSAGGRAQDQIGPQYSSEPFVNKHSNKNLSSLNKEKCECHYCVYGIERTMNADDGDSVDWFEGNLEIEELSQPVKKPKLDIAQSIAAQPEINQESSSQPTQPIQMNNQDKQFITVNLECFRCSEKFHGVYALPQLNDHLWRIHSIGPFQCLVKDCHQSFESSYNLGDHIKKMHQHTRRWLCDKCPRHFNKYSRLSVHNTEYHNLGQFLCSFPWCTFTGVHRRKVYDHYTREHKPTLNNQHSGNNNNRTLSPIQPKTHNSRIDSGSKSYNGKLSKPN